MHVTPQAVTTARDIGATVRARRADLGLDQSELSLVAGVSRRTVHAIEHGKPTIQLAALVAVLQALGLDLSARPRTTARSERSEP